MQVDLLLTNARIHTMSDAQPHAGSLAVLNGRVVALDEDVPAARAVDLGGRTVVPGFHDAHNHMAMSGMRLREIDLSSSAIRTLDELYDAVKRAAAEIGPGEWIVGSGYDQNKLGGEHPARARLDEIAPRHLVWLKHTSGHMCVVGGAVLDAADLDAVPEGGVVVRDDAGVPTGLLLEQAQELVQRMVKPYSTGVLTECIAAASQQYAAEGLVAVTECGIGGGWVGNSPVEAAAYQRALTEGRLRQRVTLMPVSDALHEVERSEDEGPAYGMDLGLRTGFGGDRLRLGAMKVFSDGSLIGHTAAMFEPFANSPGNAGFLQDDVESLRDMILGAHLAGWQVATHAIGDRAVSTVIDIYSEVLAEYPRDDHRHRIEHCGVCRPDDVARIAALGLVPTPQGRFITEIGDGMIEALGPVRTAWCYRGQSFLDAGVTLTGSSDRPVVLGAPLLGIQAMVTRRTSGGQLLAPDEAVSAYDALRAYTLGSAYASFLDDVSGSLEVGKYADLVVLGTDPLAADPETIAEISVEASMLAGELTHGEL